MKFIEFLNKIKFEYVLIIFILSILSAVMFTNVELTDSANTALLAITSLLSASSGFLFGVTQIPKDK